MCRTGMGSAGVPGCKAQINKAINDQHRRRPESRAIRNVWSAALSQAKSEGDRLVCANVYDLCWSKATPGQDGMRRALFPISNAVSKDFFRIRVWRAPG